MSFFFTQLTFTNPSDLSSLPHPLSPQLGTVPVLCCSSQLHVYMGLSGEGLLSPTLSVKHLNQARQSGTNDEADTGPVIKELVL